MFVQRFDICVLTETKLDAFIPLSAFNLINYHCNRYDRNSNGGGVLTYIKKGLHMETIFKVQQRYRDLGLEVTIDFIKVLNPNALNTIVLGIYKPPNVKQEWFLFV